MILPSTYEEILDIFQEEECRHPLCECDVVILQCEVGGVSFTTWQMHVTITHKIYVLNRLIWLWSSVRAQPTIKSVYNAYVKWSNI